MIEITESAMMDDPRTSMDSVIDELHERGLRLAIDDFGSGLPDDRNSAVLVSSIIQLSRNLGLEPLAEGIETEEQRAFFLEHGCELGQGFHFSRPVKASELETLYRASRAVEDVA